MNEYTKLTTEQLNQVAGGTGTEPGEGFTTVYQIQEGDTLGKIAAKFNCTINDLLNWNPGITSDNKLNPGDFLNIQK